MTERPCGSTQEIDWLFIVKDILQLSVLIYVITIYYSRALYTTIYYVRTSLRK
jgi:hypothetical protein